MKERGELPNEVGDAVREYRATHEENFWSSWLREEERGKEEKTARAKKQEEERGEKRKGKRKKKRTKRRRSKEDVRVLFRWRPLKSLVKGEVRRLTSESAPLSRRRLTPPTPMQNSYTSFEREQGSYEGEDRGWNGRERTIIARTKQYLEISYSVKVRVEELEQLLGPQDVDVVFRRIPERSKLRLSSR